MIINIFIFICLSEVFNPYSEVSCQVTRPNNLNVTEGEKIVSVNTSRPVDTEKSIFLRRLVGTLASLMKYEAKQENPPADLVSHVDGIVIETESSVNCSAPDQRRRKAVLIIGEMAVRNILPATENGTKEESPKDNTTRQIINNNAPRDIIEEEKLRRQEWTKMFLNQRREELKRREEWQIKDAKMREDELNRRHDWSQYVENKIANLSSTNSIQSRAQNANTSPASRVMQTLFEALDAYNNANNLATKIWNSLDQKI